MTYNSDFHDLGRKSGCDVVNGRVAVQRLQQHREHPCPYSAPAQAAGDCVGAFSHLEQGAVERDFSAFLDRQWLGGRWLTLFRGNACWVLPNTPGAFSRAAAERLMHGMLDHCIMVIGGRLRRQRPLCG